MVRMVPYEPVAVRSPLMYVGVSLMVALMVLISSWDVRPFTLYTMGLKHAISGLRVIWSSRARTLRRIPLDVGVEPLEGMLAADPVKVAVTRRGTEIALLVVVLEHAENGGWLLTKACEDGIDPT